MLGANEHFTGNVRAFIKYWVREELVSKPVGKVLKMVQTARNAKKHSTMQSARRQELVTKCIGAVQDCYVGRLIFEG